MKSVEVLTHVGGQILREDYSIYKTSGWLWFAVYLGYLAFVKVTGPRWMKHRRPIDIKFAMTVYNVFQVVTNLWLVYCFLGPCDGPSYLWSEDCSHSEEKDKVFLIKSSGLLFFYHLTKVTDLMDTIFMVLKKKDEQANFLHIYHHSHMILLPWYFLVYHREGRMSFYMALNSMVHVVMYSYYLLSGLGPSMQKYLWWKKYITWFQIVQFVIILGDLSLAVANGCIRDAVFSRTWFIFVFSNLILFLNFYRKAYSRKRPDQKRTS